jgi:Holliday junction resolvase-like predicted endonuclease
MANPRGQMKKNAQNAAKNFSVRQEGIKKIVQENARTRAGRELDIIQKKEKILRLEAIS